MDVQTPQQINQQTPSPSAANAHAARVRNDLVRLGAGWWAMWHSEASYLPQIIHPDEKLGGLAYGYRGIDFCFLVATDRRVIFLDKKPLFTDEEEITYASINGVSFDRGFIASTLVLHTKIRDYKMLVFNHPCITNFVTYLEQRSLETQQQSGTAQPITARQYGPASSP